MQTNDRVVRNVTLYSEIYTAIQGLYGGNNIG